MAKEPDEVNPDYKCWDMSILPMKLTPILLKPVKRTEAQLNVVKSFLPKAKNIINAGDPDDEGQLLVDEVLDFYGFNPNAKNVLRVLIFNAGKPCKTFYPDAKESLNLRKKVKSILDQCFLVRLNLT